VNCPFDATYRDIFRAIVFAIQDCGFVPRSAWELDDSGEVRITKIKRIIAESQHGIHDLSRVELDGSARLPRFNMPLELGLFMGAQAYGSTRQKQKRSLVLDVDLRRYRTSTSDIAGQDIKAHDGKPARAITAVRDWLGGFTSEQGILLPGEREMRGRYTRFQAELPGICRALRLEPKKLLFSEFRFIVQQWLEENPAHAELE
jgi:hypothetical protein